MMSGKRVLSLNLLSMVVALFVLTAQGAAADSELTQTPATPQEFVEQYAAASASMSAEAIASFYHAEVTSIPFTGVSRVMRGRPQQVEELKGLFVSLEARGIVSLKLADYAIMQLSDHFALTRLRWELARADDTVANVVNSTYVLRLEDVGWRVVTILEMGAPHGRD